MENFLNEVTRSALHSYTHSGLLQLGRRFDRNDVKPNYSNREIIEVIHVTTSAVFMVTSLVTKHFGFEHDWKNVSLMYDKGGQSIPRLVFESPTIDNQRRAFVPKPSGFGKSPLWDIKTNKSTT